MDYINIGTRRELFWDDYIVDTSLTTAKQRIHNPIRRDMVFLFDAPWEGETPQD